MAAPTGFEPTWDNVIITVSTGTGIGSNNNKVVIGTVEAVGLNVDRVAVGQMVLFKLGDFISIGDDSWQVIPQSNILSVYTIAP